MLTFDQNVHGGLSDDDWYENYDQEYKKMAKVKNLPYPPDKKERRAFCAYYRQRRVMINWINNGMKDLHKAVIAEGYSPAFAASNKLQISKTWQVLLEEYLPDDLIAERHRELLNKRDYVKVKDAKTGVETVQDAGPETNAVFKAIDMAYKLKGQYKEDKGGTTKNTAIYNLIYDPKLKAGVKSLEDSIKQAIYNDSTTKAVPMARGEDGVYAPEQGGNDGGIGEDGGQNDQHAPKGGE